MRLYTHSVGSAFPNITGNRTANFEKPESCVATSFSGTSLFLFLRLKAEYFFVFRITSIQNSVQIE